MAWHDYEKLSSIDIYNVLQKLGIDVIRGKKALCFMHDDHDPSLTIYSKSNSWFCFPCKKGGGVIDLVKAYFKCDTEEACKWLEVEYNIKPKPAGWKWIKRKRIVPSQNHDFGKIVVDSGILEWIIANTSLTAKASHFLFDERKIKKVVCDNLRIKAIDDGGWLIQKMIDEFGIQRLLQNHIVDKGCYGYTLTWNAPCLLFPYYDVDGRLINIQSRFLNPTDGTKIPRFRFIKESQTSIFNAQLLPQLKRFDSLLLTEGVTDCLAALSCGLNAIAIPGASAFKREYVDLLKNFSLYICPDNDQAGGRLLLEIKEKMRSRYCEVRELKLDDGSKDIGEYYEKHETLRFS